MFQFFNNDGRRNRQFTELMTIQARQPPLSIDFMVTGFKWEDYQDATIVDVSVPLVLLLGLAALMTQV